VAEKAAEGGGMIGRKGHIVVVAFGAKFFRCFFAVVANDLKEAAMIFIVRDPAGLRLSGDERKGADYDDNQGDKEPITFFDGHVQTSIASDGMGAL
jgi:hypothetical protein